MDSELEMLKGMSHWERRLYLARSELAGEAAHLDVAFDYYRDTSLSIELYERIARKAKLNYTETKSDADLEHLELAVEALRYEHMYKDKCRKDITKQRERVQWARQNLQEIQEKMERLMIT